MSVARPKPSAKKKAVTMVLGGLVALASGLLTHKLTHDFVVKHLGNSGTAETKTTAATSPAGGWVRQTVGGISFEAPGTELERQDLIRMLPIETQERMVGMDAFLTKPGNAPFQISIIRTTMKPQFPLDLEGAVKGGLANVAGAAGVFNASFPIENSTLGKFPVKRGKFDGKKGNSEIHMVCMGIQDGQSMWQVQVLFTKEDRRADAMRVLDSVGPPVLPQN